MFATIRYYLILLVSFPLLTFGQLAYQANPTQSKILIHGTSNIHDWTSWVDNFQGTTSMEFSEGKIQTIESLSLIIPVKAIKSGKTAMDDNTYAALKHKQYPHLRFQLTEVSSITSQGNNQTIKAWGNLTVAGKTKRVLLTVTTDEVPAGILFKGKLNLNMLDYGVEPPTALFGTISTGEELTIEFSAAFAAKNTPTP